MTVMEVAEKIEDKIKEIESIRGSIKERGEKKAEAISEYDKAITLVLIDLKNGEKRVFENQVIEKAPASIMEKLAKGICWKEKLAMETADAMYKSALTNLEAVCAQLNALQSLNRYLDRV